MHHRVLVKGHGLGCAWNLCRQPKNTTRTLSCGMALLMGNLTGDQLETWHSLLMLMLNTPLLRQNLF